MRVWRLAIAMSLLSCASLVAVAQVPERSVRLRPGDAVRLLVQDDTLLSGHYDVLSDGTVLLPLVGLLMVADVPFDEVAERVRAAYVKELSGQAVVLVPLLRVAVTGEVRSPGVLIVDPTYTWADVVAKAGGVLPTAARDRVLLVRAGGEQALPRAALGRYAVESGDELVVPRRGWMAENAPLLIGSATSLLVTITALLIR